MASLEAAAKSFNRFSSGDRKTLTALRYELPLLLLVSKVPQLGIQSRQGSWSPFQGGSMTSPQETSGNADLAMYQDMLSRALRFYWDCLNSSIRGRRYLKERGITNDSIQRFGLGYAESQRQALRKVFPNYQVKSLVDCGLVVENAKGRADRFRDRIMFPILNDEGRTIGFGGRILEGDRPKYLNSPETPLFHKGSLLYGVPQAQKAIGEYDMAIVVEGYLDVIMLSQSGVANVVSTLGTATTTAHLEKLKTLARRVVFCFDGDAAGTNAAIKAMFASASAVGSELDVGFVFLPKDEDPDSYVRKHGSDAFRDRVLSAMSFEAFLLRYLRKDKDLASSEGRAQLAHESLAVLDKIRDAGLFYRLIEAVARLANFTVAEMISFTDPMIERTWSNPAVVLPGDMQRTA